MHEKDKPVKTTCKSYKVLNIHGELNVYKVFSEEKHELYPFVYTSLLIPIFVMGTESLS